MHTDQHSSEIGRWRSIQRAADPRVRAYVHGYFASSSHLRAPVQERHLPSTEVPLLVNFGEPHRRLVRRSDGLLERTNRNDAAAAGEWIARDGAWIVGLHTHHQLTQALGERHFMVVRFTPLGAHLFLGLSMDAIANDAVDLEQIDASIAREIIDCAGLARSWSDRFDAIETLIAQRIADELLRPRVGTVAASMRRQNVDGVSNAVSHVWRKLVANDGQIALGSFEHEVDCSHRTLIARFRTCVGFPPKTIARLLRFNRVVRSIDRSSETRANEAVGKPYIESARDRRDAADDRHGTAIRWADIATDCGYFDQAHLIKEFREFAGATPDAFLRRMSDLV